MPMIYKIQDIDLHHKIFNSFKYGLYSYYRLMLKMILLSIVGLVILLILSSMVWLATWHKEVQFTRNGLYENGTQLTP